MANPLTKNTADESTVGNVGEEAFNKSLQQGKKILALAQKKQNEQPKNDAPKEKDANQDAPNGDDPSIVIDIITFLN